jgi:hypothetical protein
MQDNPRIIGLGKNSEVREALEDIISLLRILSSRPTHVRELVPGMPHYVGYHDAAAEGAGGVWFLLVDDMPPQVWRAGFPVNIATDVILDNNPAGKITNLDLELVAEVFAVGIALEKAPQAKHTPLGTLCGNTPTVSWIDRMASKSRSPTAVHLLRGLSIMLFANHAGRLTTIHVPGVENIMADIASRPTKAQNLFCANAPLSDANFSQSFDTTFPLPDNQRWTLTDVPKWLKFNVFEMLHSGRDRALTPLASVAGAHHPIPQEQWVASYNRPAPHICCRSVGRTVRPWSSGQGSVGQAGSQACRPKPHSGRTS